MRQTERFRRPGTVPCQREFRSVLLVKPQPPPLGRFGAYCFSRVLFSRKLCRLQSLSTCDTCVPDWPGNRKGGSMRYLAMSILFLSSLAPIASAGTLVWNLQNVNFQLGGTAVGSFTFDTTLDSVTSWNITVSGTAPICCPDGTPPDFPWADGTWTEFNSQGGFVGIVLPGFSNFFVEFDTNSARDPYHQFYLRLPDGTSLGDPGTIPVTLGYSVYYGSVEGVGATTLPGGSISTAPEPTSLMMLIAGGVGFGLLRWKHRLNRRELRNT